MFASWGRRPTTSRGKHYWLRKCSQQFLLLTPPDHCSSLIYDIWIIFWRLVIIESNWWYFQSPGLVYPQCNEVQDWHLQRCSQRGWIQLQIVEKDPYWIEKCIFRVTPCTCASQNTFVIATTWSRPEENNYVSSENILETTSAVTRDTWLPVTNKGIASTEYTLCRNILPVPTSCCPLGKLSFFRHWGENVAIFPGFPQSTCRAPRSSVGVRNFDIDTRRWLQHFHTWRFYWRRCKNVQNRRFWECQTKC